jgi:hypothetical protein
MSPDTLLFQSHTQKASFQECVDQGMWGIEPGYDKFQHWPIVLIWIQALPKPNGPQRYYFRFDLQGYPASAPTACPWNNNTNTRLENALWPTGKCLVSKTFNYNWNSNALYTPCDRVAMIGHDVWKTQFPELWWQSDFTISTYLHFLHGLLNSSDYAKS